MLTKYKVYLGNGVELEMAYIPGGSFIMGSPEGEAGRYYDEGPQHVVILEPFYMGKYPVTQKQYQAIMGSSPSRFNGKNRPVECVSWEDAKSFCQKLSEITGVTYSLPSESQWEYACRAGTTTPFNCGANITSELANYDGRGIYGNGPKGDYRDQTTDVGIFPPNGFGLYDMYGNVWEWCADEWHNNYDGAPTDGSAWVSEGNNKRRILRGGSWYNHPQRCRSAYRSNSFSGDAYFNDFGFRIVSVPPGLLKSPI